MCHTNLLVGVQGLKDADQFCYGHFRFLRRFVLAWNGSYRFWRGCQPAGAIVDQSAQFFTTACTSWTLESYVRSINCAIGTIPNWLIATPRMIPKRIFFMILLCAIGEIEPTVNDTTTHYKAQRKTILRYLSTWASEAVYEACLLFHHGVDPTGSGTGVKWSVR